ncbi:MAG: ASKHA domain-containing protein [Planctomycetota bacterium]|jgi:uncharacterized 2Fe-2S/4Fe-4S cluster protein (DUF4445 family)
MPEVLFQPSQTTVSVETGTELLDAARQVGVEIDAPCGGKGTCGKCMVRIVEGVVDSDSLGVLDRAVVAEGYVLACKTKVSTTDLVVEVPQRLDREGGKFAEDVEDRGLIRRELLPEKWEFDSLAIKWCVKVEEPRAEDGLSDLDRLTRAIQVDWGKKEIIYSIGVIRSVAEVVRAEGGEVTVLLVRDGDRYSVISIEAGNKTVNSYGVAIDIGTTTIAVQLVYLPTAEVMATRSDYNDQVTCGLDVISRINYAAKPERLEELRERVLKTVNNLIESAALSHNVEPAEICNAVIAGNTTMIHLFLGLNPEYIRLEPYTPTLLSVPYLTARDIGMVINPESWVSICPSVGSYVGGDITAGLLCTDLATRTDEVSLFIDIGTNGELAVGNSDFLMTCACSAGPAFEGGGIECGMRAAVGAIERVEVDKDTGRPRYVTIGNVAARGICGSGMITLLANLLLNGWVDGAGKLNRDKESEFIEIDGRNAKYIIVPAEDGAGGKEVSITELDIMNIIRAKAAIYSACTLMLDQIGMDFADLANIYIAGGFGRFLDIKKATVIGLVPDVPREKFHYIGNSSLTGAYMVLVSRDYHQRINDLANRMTYIDLSTEPGYMDQYTGALFMPHTSEERFPSVEKLVNN